MPGLSGVEVLKQLNEEGRTESSTIIMVTERMDRKTRLECLEALSMTSGRP